MHLIDVDAEGEPRLCLRGRLLLLTLTLLHRGGDLCAARRLRVRVEPHCVPRGRAYLLLVGYCLRRAVALEHRRLAPGPVARRRGIRGLLQREQMQRRFRGRFLGSSAASPNSGIRTDTAGARAPHLFSFSKGVAGLRLRRSGPGQVVLGG